MLGELSKDKRRLAIKSSGEVVSVWTISGIVLAACGGGGGGGGGLSFGPRGPAVTSPSRVNVSDGPVSGARVYFDTDGDGEVSAAEIAAQGNGYSTGEDGRTGVLPPAYRGVAFVAILDGAIDTDTGKTLSGRYQSIASPDGQHRIATPITDLIARAQREDETTEDVVARILTAAQMNPATANQQLERILDPDYYDAGTNKHGDDLFIISLTNEVVKDKASGRPETDPIRLVADAVNDGYLTPATISYANTDGIFAEDFDTSNHLATLTHPITITTAVIVGVVYTDKTTGREVTLTGVSNRAAIDRLFSIDLNGGSPQISFVGTGGLDFESVDEYTLTVDLGDASDETVPALVKIIVTNDNDNAPTATTSGTAALTEEVVGVAGGTKTGFSIMLADKDSDAVNQHAITIDDATLASRFAFVEDGTTPNQWNLVLLEGQKVDREADGASLSIAYTITDDTNTPINDNVAVSIIDTNDNAPTMTLSGNSEINERLATDTGPIVAGITITIADADATDTHDSSVSGGPALTFTVYEADGTTVNSDYAVVRKAGGAFNEYQLQHTGDTLDASATSTVALKIGATDNQASSPDPDLLSVTLTVNNLDEGDATYVVTGEVVGLGTLSVAVDTADPDGLKSGSEKYRWFILNSDGSVPAENEPNGNLGTGARFTLPSDVGANVYGVVVTYMDNAEQTETFTVIASPLRFTSSAVSETHNEGVGDTATLASVSAVLATNTAAVPTYRLTDASNKFEISTSGEITLKPGETLDFEAAPTISGTADKGYALMVDAETTNNGKTENARPASVTIIVQDVNDSNPSITAADNTRTATGALVDDVVDGDPGVSFKIIDADSNDANTFGSDITSTSHPSLADRFTLTFDTTDPSAKTAKLVLKPNMKIDREELGNTDTITLNVKVKDGQVTSAQGVDVTLTITDVNDNAPTATTSGTASLTEEVLGVAGGTETGFYITLADDDTDAVNNHAITIDDTTLASRFAFVKDGTTPNQWNLVLLAGQKVDREADGETLTIAYTITDDTNAPITDNIAVSITDTNDNAPTMTLSGNSEINERLATDTGPIVAGITITIADDDATDAYKSSVSGGPALTFTVYEADGTTVNSDYAVVRKAGGAVNEYQLQHTGDTLEASTTSSVALKIGVTDGVNPNPPQLPVTLTVNNSDDLADAEIYENHPLSEAIGSITVPDGASFMLSDGFDNALFRLDTEGKLWWRATPDFESPMDSDRNNIYQINVTFTYTDGTPTSSQRYDLEVQNIGPGRYDYDSSKPDGGARTYLHHRPDIPLPEEPGGLSNYIVSGHAFVTPETGPLILTWAHDPDSDFTAAQVRPIVERAFALYEAAVNVKFIEVDSSASKDIEMFFKQHSGHEDSVSGQAFSRHNSNAQMDRITFGSQTIEDFATDDFDVVLHEIGHILGLKHPFEGGREGEWSWDAVHNKNPNTIMSYYSFELDPNRGDELLPADIAALRFLYGPPEGTAGAEDWQPPHWLVRSNIFLLNTSPDSEPIFISETAAAGTELYTITVENNFLLLFTNPPTPDRSEYDLPNERDNEFFQFDSDTGVLSLKQKLDYGNPLDKGEFSFYAGNNVYEVIIRGMHSFDDAATQARLGNSKFPQYLPIVVLESIDLAQEGLTDINLVTRGAAKTPTDYGGKEVIGTDGVNRISDGHGYDIIRGNGNDDVITLTTTPKDENEVIYRIGNQVAIDGGDQIVGFERGKDELILALPENMTTSAITNFAGFVNHINGGTPTDLTDDWFGVKLVTDAGKTMLEGLSFHFEKIVVGAGSSSVMGITFSTSVPLSEVLGSTTLASITNSDGFLTDFGLLDDLLGGEQSFQFITEEFTIPTNTTYLSDVEIYENHPLLKAIGSITVPDGASFMLSAGFDNALFRLDTEGKLWWRATPDFESPMDSDRNNIYQINVTFTYTDGTPTSSQRYDLEVQNIGPGRYGYDYSNRDGGAWVYTHHYPDIPLHYEPGGLSNYILGGHAYLTPETGPLILTWAHDPDSDYTAAQVRPIIERALAMFEAGANVKFIEVDSSASKDIEMLFNQAALTGRASSRHKFSAQVDRLRVSSPTIEGLETDGFFSTLIHEIGHILGLKHPFAEELLGRTVGEWPWDAAHRKNPNTIMSYYLFENDPDRGEELLPADIAALRFLYGPPEDTAGAEDWQPPHWLVRSNNFRVNPSRDSDPIFISETATAGTELYTITVENNFSLRFPSAPTPDRSEYELQKSPDNEFFQLDSVTGVLSLKQKLDYDNPLDQGHPDLYAGNNVYEVTINGRHFFDDAAIQAMWNYSSYPQYLPIVVLESIDLATEGLTDINLETRGAAKTPTDYGGKEVIGTDGVNRISDGHGYDIIRGNGNDDIITLTATPKDKNEVIYRIGNQVALDGGDQIIGFEHGKDKLVLALPENNTTSAITNFAGFVSHINGGTSTDLTDDWFGVKLVTDAGKTMLEGLSFHFEKIVVGAGSRSVMGITFSTSVPLSEVLGSTTLASITNSDGFLTDFGLLDDLLGGEQSFKFITEEFTIPTNIMVVGGDLNDSDPSITAADDTRTAMGALVDDVVDGDPGVSFKIIDADSNDANTFGSEITSTSHPSLAGRFTLTFDTTDPSAKTAKLALNSGMKIDREELGGTDTISLNVKVKDGQATSADGVAVTLTITDVNDNAPTATTSGTASLTEEALGVTGGTKTGFSITLADDDTDAVNNHAITIDDAALASRFAFVKDGTTANQWNLVLLAGQKVDREADGASLTIAYTITDDSHTPITDTIGVSIIDTNDNAPSITATDETRTATGALVDDVVDGDPGVSFKIMDADSNAVNRFDSEITSTTHASLADRFTLTFDTTDASAKTAKLVLKSGMKIDREELGNTDTISLNIKVKDGQSTSTEGVVVTLTITDINDNAPTATKSGTASLTEEVAGVAGGTKTGFSITLADDDTDAMNNHAITVDAALASRFGFVKDGTTPNQWNLVLLAGQKVDREADGATLTIAYTITDDTNTPINDNIAVSIIDTNDNAPTMTLSGDSEINERLATDTGPIVAGITITIADDDATDAHDSSVSGGPALTFTVYEADGTTVNSDYAVVRKAGGAVNEYQLQHTGDTLDASTTSSVSLKIGVTDGVNLSPSQLPVTLTVNNVDEGDVMALELDAVYEQHPVTKEITTFAIPTGFAGATLTLSSGTLDNDLFTIRDGKLWWNSTPDYESPADADRDNVYEIEVTFTKTDGTTTTSSQRYDLEVQDIGPGRYGYDSSNRDGGAWVYTHHYPDTPLPEEPGGLSNYIVAEQAYLTPETGPLILTWALDPDSDYTAAQLRPIVERAFAMFEAGANVKFIEVDWSASKDIEMLFYQHSGHEDTINGSAASRHKFSAQVDRIRVSTKTIEVLETNAFYAVLHEIGHILGLKHPFEEALEARPVGEWPWDAGHLRNPNTIMSYYDFAGDPNIGDELLPADIAALRFLYGPPEDTAGAEDWQPPHWLVRSNHFRVNPSPDSDPIFISETAAAGTELYTITVENNFLLRVPNPPTPARSEYELPNGLDNEFFQFDSVTGVLSLKQKLDYDNPLDQGHLDLYAGNNVYEVAIDGRHFFDDEATQARLGNTTFGQYLPIVVLESIDLAEEGLTDINLVTRGAAKTPTDYGGKEVIGTDGVNRISDGHGHDIIRGNGNDDIITLTTTPKDENKVIYRIGNQVAIDGGDQVTGFERGKDKLILALPENMTTSAITNFAGFVSHINGGTPTDLTDDWFGVKLVTDAGKTMLQGLSFHFEEVVVGAGSRSVMDITFSTSVLLSDTLGSATLASITNSDGYLTDLGLLDDLLGGEQSFKFITEEFTIPTNTMVVQGDLNDSDPSITAADDLLGGAVSLGFEII